MEEIAIEGMFEALKLCQTSSNAKCMLKCVQYWDL